MPKQTEARRCERSDLEARVEVRMDSGVLVEGSTRDVSLNGLWFFTDRSLPIGNRTRVRLVADTSIGRFNVEMSGRVVRDDEGGVAIEFLDLKGESIENLRQVVGEPASAH